MQKVKLPKQLDPVKSAVKRSEYQGVMMAKDMERLQQVVAKAAEDIVIDVKFDKDAQGRTFFHGQLNTSVELVCQRCNESFTHQLDVPFCFSPVQSLNLEDPSDEVEALPEAYEPVEVNDHGEISLLSLFEDELILSLPIVALHAEEDCKMKSDEMSYGKIEPADERPNPFAVLKELKRD